MTTRRVLGDDIDSATSLAAFLGASDLQCHIYTKTISDENMAWWVRFYQDLTVEGQFDDFSWAYDDSVIVGFADPYVPPNGETVFETANLPVMSITGPDGRCVIAWVYNPVTSVSKFAVFVSSEEFGALLRIFAPQILRARDGVSN